MQKLKAEAGKKKIESAIRSEISKDSPCLRPQTCTVAGVPQTMSERGRKLIVVDVRKTMTAEIADYFVQVEPNKDYEILQALRRLLHDEELDVESVGGVPVNT